MKSDPPRGKNLSAWFKANKYVWRLGHVYGPPHKHFSAFINPRAVLEMDRRRQVADALLSDVQKAIDDSSARASRQQDRKIPVAVWYVSSEYDDARLAELAMDYVKGNRWGAVEVTPIQRLYTDQDWEFRSSLDSFKRPTGVLIVQVWTIAGTTLPQLVRLAAKSGASWIAAVCLLNQLSYNKADELLMYRTVAGSAVNNTINGATIVEDAEVPVFIRFVASTGVTAFNEPGCPICFTRKKYDLFEDLKQGSLDHSVLPVLPHRAERLKEILACREWSTLAEEQACDLFGVPVTGTETADYLRWRKLLANAPKSEKGRQEVIRRLRELAGESPPQRRWTSAGLIRLLVAEQQLLGRSPLDTRGAGRLLSQVCVRGFESPKFSPGLRVQFLMVIAAAIPDDLVKKLLKLMIVANGETGLVDQMLLDCYRLLLEASHSQSINVTRLRLSLQSCRAYLDNRLGESRDAETGNHLSAVQYLLDRTNYRILDKPDISQEAWERLREDLVRRAVRHGLESELLIVRGFVEDCEREEPSPKTAQKAMADWDTCRQKLIQRALVNLPALKDILHGDFVADWLGLQDQQRLLALASEAGAVGQIHEVTDRLRKLSTGPWRPVDPSWQALRRELLDRINWWNDIFLAAHVGDQQRPALLVELIESAPVTLNTFVNEFLATHQPRATVKSWQEGESEIFCPSKLLEQVVSHLLENVEKHRDPDEDAPDRLEIQYLRGAGDTLEMVVRNSGTRANDRPGQGLRALDEKLRSFNGWLTSQALSDDGPDGWTFAVTVTFRIWQGG